MLKKHSIGAWKEIGNNKIKILKSLFIYNKYLFTKQYIVKVTIYLKPKVILKHKKVYLFLIEVLVIKSREEYYTKEKLQLCPMLGDWL